MTEEQAAAYRRRNDDKLIMPTRPPRGRRGSGRDPHRNRHHRLSLRSRILIGCGTVLAVLLLAVGGAFAWWHYSVAEGQRAMAEAVKQAEEKVGTVEYDGKRYKLNPNIVSVCFIGCDQSAWGQSHGYSIQADTIIVFAFDTETGEMKAISVPRDSMVPVDTYTAGKYAGQVTEQICLQYAYGSDGNEGSKLTVDAVSRALYNAPINYYFTLDMAGVSVLNDAIGGVTVTSDSDVPGTNIRTGQTVTLWGRNAERFVRNRGTDTEASLGRQDRQMIYLRAFFAQALSAAKSNPSVLVDLFNKVQDYTYTNLGVDEFTYLASQATKADVDSLSITSLGGEMHQGTTFAEFSLDADSVQRAVLDAFYEEV